MNLGSILQLSYLYEIDQLVWDTVPKAGLKASSTTLFVVMQ